MTTELYTGVRATQMSTIGNLHVVAVATALQTDHVLWTAAVRYPYRFAICYILYHYYTTIIAVCSSGCYNGGSCTSPNKCSCTPQWTGLTCTTGKLL